MERYFTDLPDVTTIILMEMILLETSTDLEYGITNSIYMVYKTFVLLTMELFFWLYLKRELSGVHAVVVIIGDGVWDFQLC